MPVPDSFALDRELYARGLQGRARGLGEIRAGRRRPLNAAVARFFENAVATGAVVGPRGVRPFVYVVGAESLIVAVHDVDHRGAPLAGQNQTATVPFNVNEVLSVKARGFTVACDVVDRLLLRADDVLRSLRALRRRVRPGMPAHLPMLLTDIDGRHPEELAIPFQGGRTLRTNGGFGAELWIGADYLRVCDADGTEVASWERIEWQEDPVVISAVLACALAVPGFDEIPLVAEDPVHAVLVGSSAFGEELAIPIPGGRTLRTDAGAVGARWVGAHYLRVCDADGLEAGYWDHDEWRRDPIDVIGAVLGCALGMGDVDDQRT